MTSGESFQPMLALLAMVPQQPREGMVGMYRQALHELTAQAGDQLAVGRHDEALAAVHKLAGSAAMMQDQALSSAARAVETSLRAGDAARAAAGWPQVRSRAALTLAALDQAFHA